MLTHLRKDSTNVEMNVAWVRDLKAILNCILTEVQVVIFNFESFFQIAEGTSQFLGSSENAGEIIVRYCSISITLLCKRDSFVQQLKGYVEVLFLKETHRQDVADDCCFTSRSH